MIRCVWALLALLSLLPLLSACNDQPTAIGTDFVVDTADTYVLSSVEVPILTGYENATIQNFNVGRPLFNAGPLYVGRSDEIEAFSILGFATLDNIDTLLIRYDTVTTDNVTRIEAELKEYSIDEVRLKIYAGDYLIGDTNNLQLAFDIREFQVPETLEMAHQDTVRNLTLERIDALVDDGTVQFVEPAIHNFNESIDFNDDSLSVVDLRIEAEELLRRWFERRLSFLQRSFEDKEATALLTEYYGLALQPAAGGTAIRQFLTPTSDRLDDIPFSTLEIVISLPEEGRSETLVIEAGNDGSYVRAPAHEVGETIVLQGGAATRARITTDVSAIPKLSSIAKAELIMTIDRSRSLLGKGRENEINLVAMRLVEEPSFEFSSVFGDITLPENGSDQYVFDALARIVQTWVNGEPGDNFGLLMHIDLTQEVNELSRLVFYGPEAQDQAKRPFLRIFYHTRPF